MPFCLYSEGERILILISFFFPFAHNLPLVYSWHCAFSRLVPTRLGIVLVQGYLRIDQISSFHASVQTSRRLVT